MSASTLSQFRGRLQHQSDFSCFCPWYLAIDHRSLCKPCISLLLDTESGLEESLSRIGEEEQVELLLNRFIRLEEHVSGTGW